MVNEDLNLVELLGLIASIITIIQFLKTYLEHGNK